MDPCAKCHSIASSLFYQDGQWVCNGCYQVPPMTETCRMFEYGHENPQDPKGSTAHVREIKTRRIDPKTKTVFNYSPPKSYFY